MQGRTSTHDRVSTGATGAAVATACALVAQLLLARMPDGPVLDAIAEAPVPWVVGHLLLALVVPAAGVVVLAWRPLVDPRAWWVAVALTVVGGVAALTTVVVDLVVAQAAFAEDREAARERARWLGENLGAPLDRWDLALAAGLVLVGVGALWSRAAPAWPVALWVASLAIPGVEGWQVLAPGVQLLAAVVLVVAVRRASVESPPEGPSVWAGAVVAAAFVAAAPVSLDRALLAAGVVVAVIALPSAASRTEPEPGGVAPPPR